jgi:hypothetical protein
MRRLKAPDVLLKLQSPGFPEEHRWDWKPPRPGSRVVTRSGVWVASGVEKTRRGEYEVHLERPPHDTRNAALDLLELLWTAVSPREHRRKTFIP